MNTKNKFMKRAIELSENSANCTGGPFGSVIVKGEKVAQPGIPESFHVLLKEIQSLGLAVELLHEEEGLASWGDEGNDTDLMEMDIDSEELLLTDTTDL